jgi:hypothetical protein
VIQLRDSGVYSLSEAAIRDHEALTGQSIVPLPQPDSAVVPNQMHCTYTRQALFNQDLIRVAYETYRASNTNATSGGRPVSAALGSALDRVNRLEVELGEAKARENLLLEQFVRWAYKASTRGLSGDFLNQPLPPTNQRGNRVNKLGR